MALRSVEPEVKTLVPSDAEAAFNGLRERVLSVGNLSSPPPGFDGMGIIAKHHPRFQSELVSLVGSLEPRSLGVWIVKGWNEILTEAAAQAQMQSVMTGWARQDDNAMLKKVAGQALGGLRSGRGG
jgi:hypothetical protein